MSSPLDQARSMLEPLVDQPITQRLLSEASALRDRTLRAQEATLSALNLPTAADLAKLERRLKSLTDAVVRLDEHLDRVEARVRANEQAASGAGTAEILAAVAALREELARKS
jgi:hypothetical protein